VGVEIFGTLSVIARWAALDSSRSFDEAAASVQKAGMYLDDGTIQAVRNRVKAS